MRIAVPWVGVHDRLPPNKVRFLARTKQNKPGTRTDNKGRKGIMKFQIQLVAAILGMFLVSTPSMLKAASADDDDDDPETDNPVEIIARVSEVQKLLARYDNPCLPPVPPKPSTILAKDDGDHGDFWNLEPNKSEFDLRRLGSRRFS